VTFIPLGVFAVAALFAIRGYSITPQAIRVHRLFWSTSVPLAGLETARFEPRVMKSSIRTFGNGGIFSISGWFYRKGLGAYRAFVTDPRQTVVLRFPSRRVVLSPDDPEGFAKEVTTTNEH
jgi:hypothetical protein